MVLHPGAARTSEEVTHRLCIIPTLAKHISGTLGMARRLLTVGAVHRFQVLASIVSICCVSATKHHGGQ